MPAGAFTVSPEMAADTFRRLSELEDTVGRMVRQASVLGRTVPLGGGFAGEVGEFMARYGIESGEAGSGSAVDALVGFGRELESLKARIQEALDRYEATEAEAEGDVAAADGTDCVGGG